MATTGEVAAWIAAASAGAVALIGAIGGRWTSKLGRQTEIDKMYMARLSSVEAEKERLQEQVQQLKMDAVTWAQKASEAELTARSFQFRMEGADRALLEAQARIVDLSRHEREWDKYQDEVTEYHDENIALREKVVALEGQIQERREP